MNNQVQEATVEVTVNQLIEEALQSLNAVQRWAVNRNFRRVPANRQKLEHAVEVHLAGHDPALMATMDAEGFTSNTVFKVTPAKKGELLRIIIDSLPAILAAIIQILGLFTLVLLMISFMASSSMAQTYSGYGSSGSSAKSYASSGSSFKGYASSGSVTESYGSSGSQIAAVAAYGSTGANVAGFASSGSAAARGDFRPLRSILEKKPLRHRVFPRMTHDRAQMASDEHSPSSSTAAFAARVNRHPFLHHAALYNGREVVYKSSGVATREEAIAAWINSPPHRAALESGAISEIVCVGRVCVGR